MPKNLKLFFLFFIFFNLIFSKNLFSKVIIFDIGGVLYNPDKLGVAREIGINRFLSYLVFDHKNPNVQNLVFKTLAKINNENKLSKLEFAGTAEGENLPWIMCEWQAGAVSGPAIIEKVKKNIDDLATEGFFSSRREKILVERTIEAMFSPKVLARNIRPVKQGLDLAKECAQALHYDGRRRNRVIAFSNWDELSFKYFYRQESEAFKIFERVIISADIKLIKPHKRAFEHILKKYKINPHDCILIDDQEININSARSCGISTIWFKDNNYKNLRLKLVELGALNAK